MKKAVSSFLFADMDFLGGLSSAFNLPGNFYHFNDSNTPDLVALSQDSTMIAQDAWDVLHEQK